MTENASVGRARAIQSQGVLEVLRHVHENPLTTRAELARTLGLSRGSAAEIIGRLTALSLIEETDSEPTGQRGRPTRAVGPNPAGPVVAVADITHESWRLAVAHLGGDLEEIHAERHDRNASTILSRIRAALNDSRTTLGDRLRAVGVTLPGTISAGRVLQASNLGWHDLDVATELALPRTRTPRGDEGPVIIVGNDATLAGVAESRRGAAAGGDTLLFLTIEVGIGGVLIDRRRPLSGDTGTSGEFGHLPFADPARPCACGSRGCWDLDIDGRAMARLLGDPEPADPRTAANAVLARARAGDSAARAAAEHVAHSLGRGVAGLVNALDPELVVLSGLAVDLLDLCAPVIHTAYDAGLMRFRRSAPPPLLRPRFPTDGSLRGAAELAFDTVISEIGIHTWASREALTEAAT